MKGRILELVKAPDLVVSSDLKLLQSEIEKTPYAQSIRALYLYATHRLNPESYTEVLSETAAYTTDKKNIYQFINKKTAPTPEMKVASEPQVEEAEVAVVQDSKVYTEIIAEEREAPKQVHVNGELNRILFEGEEDFLEREQVAIDIEQSRESGVITTQPVENQKEIEKPNVSQSDPETVSETVPLVPQTPDLPEIPEESGNEGAQVIDTDPIKDAATDTVEVQEEEVQGAGTSVNFHGTEDFLPEVKLSATPVSPAMKHVSEVSPSKHELEMQQLIAEVEAKMKKRRRIAEPESETIFDKGLDFADVQDFEVKDEEKETTESTVFENSHNAEKSLEIEDQGTENNEDSAATDSKPTDGWKPMSFSGNTPDALLLQSEDKKEIPAKSADIEAENSVFAAENSEDSAFNISFFTQEVTSLETTAAEDLIRDLKDHVEPQETEEASNVPVFINTWQKWLKIDRTPEVPQVSKEVEKEKVIENFIVKEPKISKLKEESDFVVKDRGDNISHLMTETLAKLYMDQKLYAKAIKAYETLTEKFPEKKSYFAEQIKLIKELRQNRQP